MPVDFILKDYDILNSQLSTMLKASFPIKLLFTLCSYEKKIRKLSCGEIGQTPYTELSGGKKTGTKQSMPPFLYKRGRNRKAHIFFAYIRIVYFWKNTPSSGNGCLQGSKLGGLGTETEKKFHLETFIGGAG